jgi:hypothetical protein
MICANKECAKDFDAKTHNQKYCSDECCRVATNKRIMEKYYEKKAIKNGAVRKCKKCSAPLSRYNQFTVCAKCEKKKTNSEKELEDILNEISRLS